MIFEIYTVFYPGRHVCTIFRVAQFPAKRPRSYLFLSDYFDMFRRATRRSVYFNCAIIGGKFGDMQHILRGIFYTTNHSIFEISFFSDFHRRLKSDVKVNVFFEIQSPISFCAQLRSSGLMRNVIVRSGYFQDSGVTD